MRYALSSPTDSVFILVRTIPPQFATQGAEHVVVGNRTIFGWKLSPAGNMLWKKEFALEFHSHDESAVPRGNSIVS